MFQYIHFLHWPKLWLKGLWILHHTKYKTVKRVKFRLPLSHTTTENCQAEEKYKRPGYHKWWKKYHMNSHLGGFLQIVIYNNNFTYSIKCLKYRMGTNEVEVSTQHKAMILNHSKETDEISALCIQFSEVQLTPQTSDLFCSDNTNFPPLLLQSNTDVITHTSTKLKRQNSWNLLGARNWPNSYRCSTGVSNWMWNSRAGFQLLSVGSWGFMHQVREAGS